MQNKALASSNGEAERISEVVGRYLEAIYYMATEGEPVRSARLADWLGVSRPTVTIALQRMARHGLTRLGSGKTIELTPKGRAEAEAIVRRHRIIERWLTDGLGMDWIAADEEAARLEHAVSGRVEKLLYAAVGQPATCPHGNPIPGSSERNPREVSLATLSPGSGANVSRVSEVAEREIPPLLGYLQERGLQPGTRVEVLEVDQIGRNLRVRVEGRELTLSQEIASKLWVLP
jgi:DtxR family Mn-dependent transcriptional regulator